MSASRKESSEMHKGEVYEFMQGWQRAELAIRVCCYRAGFTRDFANKVYDQYRAPTKRKLFYE